MYRALLFSLTVLTLPWPVFAQSLQVFLTTLVAFINGVLIPFLLGIGFLAFVFNAIRFFVLGSSEQEGREKARALALYSILAFVLILVFWGIVNLLTSSLGLNRVAPDPDYIRCTPTPGDGVCSCGETPPDC